MLKNSQALVQSAKGLGANPLDLVFHGGSGSDKDKIHESLDYGVFKMNIDTDTQFAFAHGVGTFVKENEMAFFHQIDPESGKPYKKQYDPRTWLRLGEKALIERLSEAFIDLKSNGKSVADKI